MICFCLNNLRSESWMDAEYGNWSFEGMTLLWRCCEIENFSGQEECIFEKLCILWFWIYLQDSGLVTTAGFVLGGRWASSLTEGTTNVNWLKESSVEMETLTISQDRQNMYLFWELFRLWSWKIAGPALRLHAMCGNWIIGFKRRGVIWSWGASEVLKIQGLVKCWHFDEFGLCVKVCILLMR